MKHHKPKSLVLCQKPSASQKRLMKYKELQKIRQEIEEGERKARPPRVVTSDDNSKGAGKAHMMKKLKEWFVWQ